MILADHKGVADVSRIVAVSRVGHVQEQYIMLCGLVLGFGGWLLFLLYRQLLQAQEGDHRSVSQEKTKMFGRYRVH
ncbi:MAG: hypothetical protein NZL83_00430 [Candidatus Absconditabacterales bacterium]|nr:hypothetical protein [Candidatus Absconditabacterales bacterium]